MSEFPSKDRVVTVTIADSETDSAAVDLGGARPVMLLVPSGFEGTEISFKASTTLGGTYSAVRDAAGDVITLTVTAGDFVRIEPTDTLGMHFIKLVAGTAQTDAADIEMVTFPF